MKTHHPLIGLAIACSIIVGGCTPKTEPDPAPKGNSKAPELSAHQLKSPPSDMPMPSQGSSRPKPYDITSTKDSSIHPSRDPSLKNLGDPQRKCLSSIKQLAMGLLMLASDTDNDVLKVKRDGWETAIQPYIRKDVSLKCPGDATGKISYSFNRFLANVSLTSINIPAETVMVYEGKGDQLDFRHEGRAAVAFSDGHATFVSKNEAVKLRWKP